MEPEEVPRTQVLAVIAPGVPGVIPPFQELDPGADDRFRGPGVVRSWPGCPVFPEIVEPSVEAQLRGEPGVSDRRSGPVTVLA